MKSALRSVVMVQATAQYFGRTTIIFQSMMIYPSGGVIIIVNGLVGCEQYFLKCYSSEI